jgi:hypothetical protein
MTARTIDLELAVRQRFPLLSGRSFGGVPLVLN